MRRATWRGCRHQAAHPQRPRSRSGASARPSASAHPGARTAAGANQRQQAVGRSEDTHGGTVSIPSATMIAIGEMEIVTYRLHRAPRRRDGREPRGPRAGVAGQVLAEQIAEHARQAARRLSAEPDLGRRRWVDGIGSRHGVSTTFTATAGRTAHRLPVRPPSDIRWEMSGVGSMAPWQPAPSSAPTKHEPDRPANRTCSARAQ